MSESPSPNIPVRCEHFCPPEWTGHWRDWHRGHGCHLDPGHLATAQRIEAARLASTVLSERFGRDVAALDNRDGTISITLDARDVPALLDGSKP